MKNLLCKKLFSLSLISIFLFSQIGIVQAKQHCCNQTPACECQQPSCPCTPEPCECQTPACSFSQPSCCEKSSCCCEDGYAPIIEHLCTHKNSPVDLVKICGCTAIVEQHSVIQATFAQKISSKKLCPGDTISFYLKDGLCTREGRKIIPNCSQIIAKVECIVPPKALNKNAKVGLKFKCVLLPNGKAYPIQARIFNSEGMLKESKLMAAGKVALHTVTLFGVGAGLGGAIGAGSGHAAQACLTIGMPVGAGVGLLTGLLTPGLHYRAKSGEKILIQLTDNFQIDI